MKNVLLRISALCALSLMIFSCNKADIKNFDSQLMGDWVLSHKVVDGTVSEDNEEIETLVKFRNDQINNKFRTVEFVTGETEMVCVYSQPSLGRLDVSETTLSLDIQEFSYSISNNILYLNQNGYEDVYVRQ